MLNIYSVNMLVLFYCLPCWLPSYVSVYASFFALHAVWGAGVPELSFTVSSKNLRGHWPHSLQETNHKRECLDTASINQPIVDTEWSLFHKSTCLILPTSFFFFKHEILFKITNIRGTNVTLLHLVLLLVLRRKNLINNHNSYSYRFQN